MYVNYSTDLRLLLGHPVPSLEKYEVAIGGFYNFSNFHLILRYTTLRFHPVGIKVIVDKKKSAKIRNFYFGSRLVGKIHL